MLGTRTWSSKSQALDAADIVPFSPGGQLMQGSEDRNIIDSDSMNLDMNLFSEVLRKRMKASARLG